MTDSDSVLVAQKALLRGQAAQARATAFAALGAGAADAALRAALVPYRGKVLAGYLPMRSETSPLAAMAAHDGPICVPVVIARGQPLRFRAWTPGAALEPGGFGTSVPVEGAWMVPEVLIVPLLAFDTRLYRLGYGGGFYDRTLAALRAAGGCTALGLGFAAQRMARVPTGLHDAPLDGVVTEAGLQRR
jgi:5-formyltetrahydrofolate cyclo-ligase